MDHQAAEDRAIRVIGLIITRWNQVDQAVWNGIGQLQMHLRYRRAQSAKLDLSHTNDRPRVNLSTYHPRAGSKPMFRFRHARKLVRLVGNDQLGNSVGLLYDEAKRLYAIRNDFAHAEMSITLEGDIKLSSREWPEKAQKEFESDVERGIRDRSEYHEWFIKNFELLGGRKLYSWDSANQASIDLFNLAQNIRGVLAQIPYDGEHQEPVMPPTERGKMIRLTK